MQQALLCGQEAWDDVSRGQGSQGSLRASDVVTERWPKKGLDLGQKPSLLLDLFIRSMVFCIENYAEGL